MSTATAVKERPIMFSADMVCAIIDGRKTQTRRALSPQPLDVLIKQEPWANQAIRVLDGARCWCAKLQDKPPRGKMIYCRFGEVGDRLWVRESWAPCIGGPCEPGNPVLYRADNGDAYEKLNWKPSIHMPRWASRLLLEITDVRVERLHSIGKDGRKAKDVLAEGIEQQAIERMREFFHPDDSPALAFAQLWEQINGKGSWRLNPWVWVVSFKRIK